MKRIIAFILAMLLIGAGVITASANSIVEYKDWSVCFAPGEDIAFYIHSCKLTDEEITIPDSLDGVKIIGIDDDAFANNTTVKKITMNPTIEVINKHAFYHCTSLSSVVLSPTLTTIGDNAFEGTGALKTLNLQTTQVKEIGKYAFLFSGIRSITLPDSCEAIDEYAFYQCADLERIVIPDSVTSISETAFRQSPNVVIYTYEGSYAVEYATANNLAYQIIEKPDPDQETYIIGDADGDGVVTIIDATRIQRVLADLVTDDDGMIALRGDANSNGLDIMDATQIQRYLVGLIDISLHIGETGFLPVA